MPITPEDLTPIKDLLKEAGIQLQDGQFEKIVATLNKVLLQSEEINRQTEAEMGPEAWAKMKAQIDESLAMAGKDFTNKLQQLLDSTEPTDKL